MDLDAYRRTADRFITELMREYYRHYAGLKDSFEIEAIYAAHEGLFTRDAVQALRELDARITEDGDERRRARMLLDFAVESYVGAATKAVEEELAGAEAALTIEVGDERIGFREGPVVQASEADPGRRAEIERALLTATDERLGSHYRERIERQHACAAELGWSSYATRASTAPATCGRGRSRPICARTCASGSGRRGSSRARLGTSCGGCGATASVSTRKSCSGS